MPNRVLTQFLVYPSSDMQKPSERYLYEEHAVDRISYMLHIPQWAARRIVAQDRVTLVRIEVPE